jgi:hypothetical protein
MMVVHHYAQTWLHEKSCWCCGAWIFSYCLVKNVKFYEMSYVFLLMQLVMLDHMFLAYPIGTPIISKGKSLSANKTRCILHHSECSAQLIKLDDISNCIVTCWQNVSFFFFSPWMLSMHFPCIPVMNILVIWALIQLVLPPHHSAGRLKEPAFRYALLRSGVLRDMVELLIGLTQHPILFFFLPSWCSLC